MKVNRALLCTLVLLGTVYVVRSAVSGTACSGGGNACDSIANAECDGSNCKCSDGFVENADKCDASVSGKSCTVAGKQCDAIGHATCVSTNCKCDAGYREKNNKCEAIFGIACNVTADCAGLVNANCADKKCGCATDYAGKNDLCVQVVSSMICSDGGTECDTIKNAECDISKKRCKCGDGFVEKANACETKSGAVSVTSAVSLVFGSLIMLLVRVF